MTSYHVIFYCLTIIILFGNASTKKKETSLTARDLLETIAPTYKQTKLPPGFPSLDTINTDKFDYKTGGNVIKVSAKLDKPVIMFPDYVVLSNVRMNFTFNKKAPKNSAWKIDVAASWSIGSTILHVKVTQNGKIHAQVDSLELRDIVHEFMKDDADNDIGIDLSAITLSNVTVEADITKDLNGINVNFIGKLKHISLDTIPIKINVNKYENTKTNLYSVIEFKDEAPEKVLKKLLNQKTLNVPFFAHMLTDSALFSEKKDLFGFSFSYREVYYYPEHNIPGEILRATLQSHIPEGVTVLFPLKIKQSSETKLPESIKIAFVVNKPAFDLLISQEDKIAIQQILPILSKEFENDSLKHIPNFITNINDAYTTHISFDSTSTIFSIFVRLHDTIELAKELLRIKLTHLVLQRNVGRDDSKQNWKVAAKGIFKIGKSKLHVQYSELSDEPGKPYGLTGFGNEVSLEDVITEFNPDFFPNDESQQMIENTEIESIKVHKVRLYSRVAKGKKGNPHVLLTGLTNLPQWEKDIQMAILLLYENDSWYCKWAASLKHSPLSNIIQAFTGFDSRDLKLLHNGHILTTLISSTLPSYSMLPPHIITTPLLRLPVKKAISIVALLRFPDNCGDDKLCTAAATILDTSNVYTVKGIISMDGFKLKAKISEPIKLSTNLKGLNSSLQFTIGNSSKMNVITSIALPRSKIVFDGSIHIYKTGQIQLQMYSRQKHWVAPLGFRSISFKDLQLITFYTSDSDLSKLKLEGNLTLGAQGNGAEIKAPLKLNYNPISPTASTFYANFSDITLEKLLNAFSIEIKLPSVLEESDFPNGLMLSYSGKGAPSSFQLHGEINIFGRLLNCDVKVKHPGSIKIITENSPAPTIYAKGLIIIQQDIKTKLRGPKIIANINHKKANVTVNGFVKILGMESDVNIALKDNGIKFSVTGKLMDYKQTKLTAYSLDSTDNFQITGCLNDITEEIQDLLIEIISRSANQSIFDMEKADENYLKAQHKYDLTNLEEQNIRQQTVRARDFYEEHLLAFGRSEIKVNDTCVAPKCGLKCFGCPKLNKCCRLDIFGHCIACSSWKECCWKNINPLCIAKHDGCHVVRTVAERDLTEREAQLIQQRIILDNLDQHLLQSEVIKGKHKAILDAAVDAKQIVSEEASPGLNAHDALRGFGDSGTWVQIFDVCYNTSIQQAATGCMEFKITAQFFNKQIKSLYLWSCLKEDLITEITESIANYLFPNIIDTNTDSITDVASKLNTAEFDSQMEQLGDDTQSPIVNEDKDIGKVPVINIATTPSQEKYPIGQESGKAQGGKNQQKLGGKQSSSGNNSSSNPSAATQQESESQQPLMAGSTSNAQQPSIAVSTGNNGQQTSQTSSPSVPATKPNGNEKENNNGQQSSQPSSASVPAAKPNGNEKQNNNGQQSSQPSSATVPAAKPNGNEKQNNDGQQSSQPSSASVPAAKPNGNENQNKQPSNPTSLKEDEELLNTALEEAAEGDEDIIDKPLINTKQPANSVSPNGKPQVKLINASRLQDYQHNKPSENQAEEPENEEDDEEENEKENETEGEDEEEKESDEGSTSESSSGKEIIDKELKELYDFETSGSGENKKMKKKVQKQQKGVLADQLIEQEEIDEEELDKQGKIQQQKNREEDKQKQKLKINQITSNDFSTNNKTKLRVSYPQQNMNGNVSPQYTYPYYNYKAANQNPSYNQAPVNNKYKSVANQYSSQYPNPYQKYNEQRPKAANIRPYRNGGRLTQVNKTNWSKPSTNSKLSSLYANFSNTGHSSASSAIQYYKARQQLQKLKPKKTKKKKKEKKSTKHSRNRRDIDAMIRENIPVVDSKISHKALFTSPFWNIKTDHDIITTRSKIPTGPNRQTLMKNVIHKRWKIPDNSNARCHVFHQLIAICKDMAETILMLDKALKESNNKFNDEDKDIYLELFETESFLSDAATRINVTGPLMNEVGKTLAVVRQGVNIWSHRCTSEFEWQNQSGVQTWLQAMDIRIQELGGYGVYRFLENLFHAFEALFEALTYSDTSAAKDAMIILKRIRKISKSFDQIFRRKLSITHSRIHAEDILKELGNLRKDTTFC